MVSPPKGIDLDLDPFWIKTAHLIVDHVTITVEQKERGYAPHLIPSRQLPSDGTPCAETKHLNPSLKIALQPVYDRLCQQARSSGIRIEFDQCRLAIS